MVQKQFLSSACEGCASPVWAAAHGDESDHKLLAKGSQQVYRLSLPQAVCNSGYDNLAQRVSKIGHSGILPETFTTRTVYRAREKG